jgi:hypothetical protein
MGAGRAPADPLPALHQKLLPRPVGFEVEGGNDPIPDQDWANKIAKYPLVLGNVSFEAILVIEEEPESLALDDQRVEGRQDMNLFLRRIGNGIESLQTDPVQRLARSFQLHGDQFLSTDSRLHQTPHGWFACSVQMTDRFHTHDPLRLQGTIQQVVQCFPFGGCVADGPNRNGGS